MYGLNSDGATAFNSALAFFILSGISVGLRFYTRTLVKAGFAADDWWILAALLSFWIAEAVLIWGQSFFLLTRYQC